MTDDEHPDEPPADSPSRLDVDAAWAEIVANYGPRDNEPLEDDDPPASQPSQSSQAAQQPRSAEELSRFFHPAWRRESEPVDAEEHFVPPPPPPLPHVDPRRKIAWMALFGSPVVALLAVALRVALASWVLFGLGVAFVSGFGYLVATMRPRVSDEWGGDDGAVL